MAEEKKEFTKYEKARIIGARGLQISMDAPLLVKMDEEELNGVNYDPLRIAEKELNSGVLPITVTKPMPEKKETKLDKLKIEEPILSDAVKEKVEAEEESEIAESGEIMQIESSGEDETEEDDSDDE